MKPQQIALALLAAVIGVGALLSVILTQNPTSNIATISPQTQVAQVTQSSITMGETNSALSNPNDSDVNYLVAQQFTLSQTATLQSLSFYVTNPAGKLRLGIYDASGPSGGPGNKVAETNEITPVKGLNTTNVTSPTSLSAGTSYWLAYLTNSSSLTFPWSDSSGSYKAHTYTYAAMPTPFPSSPDSGTGHAAIFATLNVTVTSSNPPSITGVAVPTVTSTGATITWNTNIPSDTQVYYGLTDQKFDYTKFDSHTALTDTNPLVTSHSVTLTGLKANTTYYFQVRSTANGQTSTISQPFTTSQSSAPVTL